MFDFETLPKQFLSIAGTSLLLYLMFSPSMLIYWFIFKFVCWIDVLLLLTKKNFSCIWVPSGKAKLRSVIASDVQLMIHGYIYSSFSHRKCGQRPPSNPLEVTSSGNIMLINFITDSVVQRPGFEAEYKSIPRSKGKEDIHGAKLLTIIFQLHFVYFLC